MNVTGGGAPAVGTAAPPPEADERLRRDQRRRIRMIGVSALNYITGGAVLLLYAWVGSVGWMVPVVFTGVSVLGNLGFVLAVRSGLNLHSRDPNLFVWQMAFAGVFTVSFLAYVPQLAFVFLTSLFVTAAFGMVQFTVKQFVVSTAILSVAVGIVFVFIWDRLALPASTTAEVILLWVAVVSSLMRFVAVASNVGALRGKLMEKNELLQQSLLRIQELADHDDLTRALARRRFMQVAQMEILRSERTKEDFCIALLDLDHFKKVNDQHGHLVGDEVLRRFCEVVRHAVRASDQLGRYGGEEFALLLPALPRDNAPLLMERITRAVEAHNWQQVAPELRVTVSIGVTAVQPGDSVASLLDRADGALYVAKSKGRNRSEFDFGPSSFGLGENGQAHR